MSRQTILAIDDEKDILKLLQYNLEKEGYQTLLAKSGEEGLELAKAKRPDLILLDIMMPGMDGLEVCKLLGADKDTKNIPVIMLTAKSSELDQVVGLEIGAADYVSKPFSVKVLLAKIKKMVRKASQTPSEEPVLKAGDLLLDKTRMSFTVKGKFIALTKIEFRILEFLMANRGKVFSRDKLLSGAWDGEAFVVDRTVDVHIKSIRKKLGKYRDMIETIRGTGYRFSEADIP